MDEKNKKNIRTGLLYMLVAAVLVAIVFNQMSASQTPPDEMPTSDFIVAVEEGRDTGVKTAIQAV